MVEYWKQLLRNECFLERIEEIKGIYKRDTAAYYKEILMLCGEYDLNYDYRSPLFSILSKGDLKEEELLKNPYLDICIPRDELDNYLNERHARDDVFNKSLSYSFPISLRISPRASKREVLDYIEKNWDSLIKESLDTYSEDKQKIFRERANQDIFDDINELKKQGLSNDEICMEIERKYPSRAKFMTKSELNNILNQIKNRRKNPIK